MGGGFEFLEHTADIGVRAWGNSVEEACEEAGCALADILGARVDGPGIRRSIVASGDDEGAVLVDFLNQLILLHETEELGFAALTVRRVAGNALEADVDVVPLRGAPHGIPVKAATFHQLEVRRRADGRVEAKVYLDV